MVSVVHGTDLLVHFAKSHPSDDDPDYRVDIKQVHGQLDPLNEREVIISWKGAM